MSIRDIIEIMFKGLLLAISIVVVVISVVLLRGAKLLSKAEFDFLLVLLIVVLWFALMWLACSIGTLRKLREE